MAANTLVTVLPFFLVAHIPTEDSFTPGGPSRWEPYGPECTYEILINMTLPNYTDKANRQSNCSIIRSDLKCRPKHSDSLSCQFKNPRIGGSSDCSTVNEYATSDRFFDLNPFEIRFNSRGIENLVVQRTIPRWRLDTMKAIVSQLNLGIENGEKRERFDAMENSTVGYCQVQIKVSRYGYQRDNGEEKDFELVLEEPNNNADLGRGAVLEIDKTRRPESCTRKAIYFFGNYEDFTKFNKGMYMDMRSSTSRIVISKQKFSSYTIVEGTLKGSDNTKGTHPRQKISVTLKSIVPARTPVPTISNPASTSVHAYSHIDRVRRKAWLF